MRSQTWSTLDFAGQFTPATLVELTGSATGGVPTDPPFVGIVIAGVPVTLATPIELAIDAIFVWISATLAAEQSGWVTA
jgi:hypothetical protein